MRAHDGDMFYDGNAPSDGEVECDNFGEDGTLVTHVGNTSWGDYMTDAENEAQYEPCQNCCLELVLGGGLCPECAQEAQEYEAGEGVYITKGERRANRSHKNQTGPIRHLPGDYRPAKMNWNVR